MFRDAAEPFDHGILNVPLAKRMGNIDAQIDRFLAEQKREADAAHRAALVAMRAKKARVAQLLAEIPDERILVLGKIAGTRTPATARAALLRIATSHLDQWIPVCEREVAKFARAV